METLLVKWLDRLVWKKEEGGKEKEKTIAATSHPMHSCPACIDLTLASRPLAFLELRDPFFAHRTQLGVLDRRPLRRRLAILARPQRVGEALCGVRRR